MASRALAKQPGQLAGDADDDWGTPDQIVRRVRWVLGWIDVDPASDLKWNARIGAERIITEAQDGLRTPWFAGAPMPGNADGVPPGDRVRRHVFCNPPGDRRGELVAGFWRAVATYYGLGWITSAVWLGFSIEQLSRLQRVGSPLHPLDFPTCLPEDRIRYDDDPGRPGEQPTHASYITCVSDDREVLTRFVRAFGPLGSIARDINH